MVRNVNGEALNAALLDKVIGDVTGYKTSFLTKNNNGEIDFHPFLLEDSRKVYIAGEEKSDMTVLVKEGKTLYPSTKIMHWLGYTVSSNEQSLYIESAENKFRFPLSEPFYVYNERRHNVKSTPFERIGDEFYFEEGSFIRIFRVVVQKNDEMIDIFPSATFAKEVEVN